MDKKLIVGNIKMNMKFGEIPNYLNHFENINNKNIVRGEDTIISTK